MNRMIDTTGLNLPSGVYLKNYDGDILILGTDLNKAKYKQIKACLPSEMKARVIGYQVIPVLHRYVEGGCHPSLMYR